MLPILRSVISRVGRSVVSRRSFNTAALTNSNALMVKFGGAWSYVVPLVGVGLGYGSGVIIVGDNVAECEEARQKTLKLRKARRGESVEIVDLREKMWTGVSNRRASWERMWSGTRKT
ncbi:hypothetical protein AALP_AA6G154100 [Arabis alpina]|uniref:Uncharacterized protein n=1 Tax=Arabis alpina TaxID=50452 RepID=A0A087GPE6_ARAAL|nr:hypothetical protein AALP_AA6G154100 [Arabis alpina]